MDSIIAENEETRTYGRVLKINDEKEN